MPGGYKRMKRSYQTAAARPVKRPVYVFKSRSSRRYAKKRMAILWLDRTVSKGLSFPQADTFPPTQMLKFHYNVVSSMTSTGSGGVFVVENFFRLNDIYDPVVAVGGAQPYYYDTVFGDNGTSAPYRNWRVIRSRVDIQFFNDNSSASASLFAGVQVGLDLSAVSGTTGGAQQLMERPNARVIPVGPQVGGTATSGFTLWVDHKKLLGVKDMKDADDQIGAWNAGPTGPDVTLGLFQFPVDTGSVTTIELWYRLHITYYVECRTLNTVTDS